MYVFDGSRLALIIGIDAYKNRDLEPLPSCKKDAQDLSSLLSKIGYMMFENSPIIGSNLVKEEYGWVKVREAIFNFFSQAKPSQTLLFYFSGHGVHGDNEIYLATPQVDPKTPGIAGFPLSELTKRMASSKSKQIVGIIDACYSGTAGLPSSVMKKKAAKDDASRALATYDKIWKNTPKAKVMYLLLSSQSYEPSNAVENSNSLYTRYLIEGLSGMKFDTDKQGRKIPYSGSVDDNGNVTPQSLHEYVYNKVANVAEQVPEFKSDQSSNIILANYPELGLVRPIDLSEWVTVHDVGEEGTAAAFVAITAMETSLAWQGKPILLSARYVYEKSKKHDESVGEGTWLTTVTYIIQQFGATPESAWPYKPKARDLPRGSSWKKLDRMAATNKARTFLLTSYDDIPTHLSLGRPIIAAVAIHSKSFLSKNASSTGIIPYPDPNEELLGVGCITIVKYDPKDSSIRFANSWGTRWGDKGFGSMNEKVARAILQTEGMYAVEVPVTKEQ